MTHQLTIDRVRLFLFDAMCTSISQGLTLSKKLLTAARNQFLELTEDEDLHRPLSGELVLKLSGICSVGIASAHSVGANLAFNVFGRLNAMIQAHNGDPSYLEALDLIIQNPIIHQAAEVHAS